MTACFHSLLLSKKWSLHIQIILSQPALMMGMDSKIKCEDRKRGREQLAGLLSVVPASSVLIKLIDNRSEDHCLHSKIERFLPSLSIAYS
jgi:hypothetical protein